jgi:alpha/beta superfamily hydrolase
MAGEEPVQFMSEGLRLEGMLAIPPGARSAAVVCHPHPLYGGNMQNSVVRSVAKRLQRDGIATLRFNFRSAGKSEGRYDEGVGETADARAACRFLIERSGAATLAIVGYSFGAVVGLRAGHEDGSVERLVAIAPPLGMFAVDFLVGCTKEKLFLIGDRDQDCPLDVFERTVAGLPPPVTAGRLAGADHFFSGYEDEVAEHVARFVSAHREMRASGG